MSDSKSKNLFPIDEVQRLMDMGFWSLDLKTKDLHFSDGMLAILGVETDKKFQLNQFLKIMIENDRDRIRRELDSILQSPKPFIIEFKILKQKSIHQVAWSGAPIFSKEGEIIRIMGLGQEISEHKNILSLIQASTYKLKRTQRIANIGNWSWDIANKKLECDDEMYAICGVSPQQVDLNFKSMKSFFSPLEWKKCLFFIRNRLKTKKEGWFEQKIFSADGSQKNVAIFFEFEINESDEVQFINGIVQDVTKQKLVHEQLRYRIEFERMVGAISSNFINLKSARIDEGIKLALDIIGTFMNVNRAYLFLFFENDTLAKLGYEWHSELIGNYGKEQQTYRVEDYPLILGTVASGEALYIEDLNQISEKYENEKIFLSELGVQSVIRVPLQLEGKVIGLLGFDSVQMLKAWSEDEISLLRICGEVFVNALSRKNYELDLKRNEEHLSIVVDSIGDAVIALDNKNKIARVNIAAEILTGYHHKELIGKGIEEVLQFINKPEDVKVVDIIFKILEKNKWGETSDSWKLVTKERKILPVMINGSPIKGANIGVIGTVLICREITNQIKLEEQLRHSEKMRAVGQLSGGIAHDFNNLLTGIIGCANYLKKHIGPNPQLQEYVENILITGRRAATLTSQLLAFSRFEKPRLSDIDINFLISEMINLLKHTIDPRIRIHKELRSPYFILEGDESQLHNAVLNLAVNARDAMPSGGDLTFGTDFQEFTPETCTGEFSSLKPGRFIVLSIKDNGSGIPHELISHIFEPFFTTKEKGKGTGLGLAAVYGTVLAHHGVITVQSVVNTYTVFKLYLPLLMGNSVNSPIVENISLQAIHNKKRILIVDDEILLCTLACELLSDAGYATIEAYSGAEALHKYRKDFQNIDLVIVDMLMPNMNGTELLGKMFELNANLKAIVISGFTGNLDLNDIIRNKKIPFLQKPFEESNLLRLIEQTLSK